MVRYIKGATPATPSQNGHKAEGDPDPELLTNALALAARGIGIFPLHGVDNGECTCGKPCKSPGKHPRSKNGSKDATTDEQQIRAWWNMSKNGKRGRLNFGQTLKGRAVADIDVADGKPGLGTWEALCAALAPSGWSADTLTYKTGRGGVQHVFRLPEGQQGGAQDDYTNGLGEAVDFKTGPNQYVLVPGSKTVGVYTVTVEAGEALLPEWIAELAQSKTPRTITRADGSTILAGGMHFVGMTLDELVNLPPDDHRRGNNWLTTVAGHVALKHSGDKDGYRAECAEYNGQSENPIKVYDFDKTTDSIWNAEQRKDREEVNRSIRDAHIGARVAKEYLEGSFVAWGKSAWSRWTGKRWERCTDTTVLEAVRRAVIDVHKRETQAARDDNKRALEAAYRLGNNEKQQDAVKAANKALSDRLKELQTLFNLGKIDAVRRVARGLVEIDQAQFDAHPDLLNAGNGVIDLRTGALRPHDPGLYLTRLTKTNFMPGARHRDFDTALKALPEDEHGWIQVRFGQALSGRTSTDDKVLFLSGGGENGKTTVIGAINGAIGKGLDGGYAVAVPDKALLGNANDHTTELMTLKDARFAYIEELPEGDYLNAQRLKKIIGTETMTARYIAQDTTTWDTSHTLFVTTNYDVKVDAVDHGTWRRLVLVTFPFTFTGSKGDPNLRDRIKAGEDGQHEAALAWLVEGAKRWYQAGRVAPAVPERVRRDTQAWKSKANDAIRFLDETFEPATGHAVRSTDVFEMFKAWAEARGVRPWNDQVFWSRAQQHSWFLSGDAEKTNGVVRTRNWTVYGGAKDRERLVTGIRLLGEEPGPDPMLFNGK
ncbi:phage/plasmid primase, P4 family, C-terminal domain-containing protein [Streptomyces sp. WMMB 714]|uniref:phage/plasmid primase, P4 family n=1 Tax=Streptomyces sp. WMMB 714 TaxID=1286822 RepID=UPI0005F89175|nr:phage/plasmid primase, P4 family [Streptomyces sp. WMMB 714]SCK37228.1 phage/plasmid primase, P4 family, C-terminal domain-containing protein [Streptomyces sp. WMMB 714]